MGKEKDGKNNDTGRIKINSKREKEREKETRKRGQILPPPPPYGDTGGW